MEKGKISEILKKITNLLGAGPYLLLLGIFFESLTIAVWPGISFPVSLSKEIQIILSITLISMCLAGMMWFYRSLNLIKVNFLNKKPELITHGPFSYVRHPLYATWLLTIPPLVLIWFSDLIFLVPWAVIFILSHFLVSLEEKELIEIFGEDYKRYRRFVPSLLPYKGDRGKLYRQHC